ncbi:hypothetical protein [Streptomyces sp. NPDC001100]
MIAVLTSGVALGVHVPGLLLARRLTESGRPVRVDVLERFLPPDRRSRIPASKHAFHRDFRLALAGQRLSNQNSAGLDEEAVRALLAEWTAAEVDLLVVLSGFWLPAARWYAAQRPGVRVHACHVDSVASPSFTSAASSGMGTEGARTGCRDVWLLEEHAGSIARTIPVSPAEPVGWAEREPRFLVHGGGWGMGTYAARARELADCGLALDIIAYERGDIPGAGAQARASDCRYFMIDPNWHPWHDDGFPLFGQVQSDGRADFRRSAAHHDSFHLARSAMAMISKPGGGTLMDSLAAATPVVLLEPFGAHEAHNARLWERLGFGIPYAAWQRSGRSPALLEGMHHRLLDARARATSYPDSLIKESAR